MFRVVKSFNSELWVQNSEISFWVTQSHFYAEPRRSLILATTTQYYKAISLRHIFFESEYHCLVVWNSILKNSQDGMISMLVLLLAQEKYDERATECWNFYMQHEEIDAAGGNVVVDERKVKILYNQGCSKIYWVENILNIFQYIGPIYLFIYLLQK